MEKFQVYIKVERNIINPLLPISSPSVLCYQLSGMFFGGLEAELACITSILNCSRRLLKTVKQE